MNKIKKEETYILRTTEKQMLIFEYLVTQELGFLNLQKV